MSASETDRTGSPQTIRAKDGSDRCSDPLAWIRTLPRGNGFQVSGESAVIEAAHTNVLGRRGMGQKTTDFSAIPLCAAHHRENLDSYHLLGEKEFSHKHRIDLKELVLRLQSRFWQQDVSASLRRSFR